MDHRETRLWQSYVIIRDQFPLQDGRHDEAIRKISLVLPRDSDPEIQTQDCQFIDILCEGLVISLLDNGHYSVSLTREFHYFRDCSSLLTSIPQ